MMLSKPSCDQCHHVCKAKQDKALHIPSKIIVYEGLSMDENDRIHIPFRSELKDTNALLVSGGKKICGIFSLKKGKENEECLYDKSVCYYTYPRIIPRLELRTKSMISLRSFEAGSSASIRLIASELFRPERYR